MRISSMENCEFEVKLKSKKAAARRLKLLDFKGVFFMGLGIKSVRIVSSVHGLRRFLVVKVTDLYNAVNERFVLVGVILFSDCANLTLEKPFTNQFIPKSK